MPKPNNIKAAATKKKDKGTRFWIPKIFSITLVISVLFSLISQKVFLSSESLILPLLVILIIVLVGVIFDIIGTAVTSASETPFLSMSAKKIKGAKAALGLIKNAHKVSSFCNDVVGDICGIISGAAGSMLVLKIVSIGLRLDLLTVLTSGLIAAVTVAGKAMGKRLAIQNSQKIIYSVGYLLSFFLITDYKNNNDTRTNKRKGRNG